MKKFVAIILSFMFLFFASFDNTYGSPILPKNKKHTVVNMSYQSSKKTFEIKKGQDFKKGEVIVRFKKGISTSAITRKLNSFSSYQKKKLLGGKASIISVPKGKSTEAFINELIKDPDVLYAEPNYVCKVTETTPNDPYYKDQWYIPEIEAQKAWDITEGSSNIIVAVIDTGVDVNHPDLKDKIVKPYNVLTNSTDVTDYSGHGTHVSGIIAATIDNGVGIAGIAPHVKIMPVAVFSGDSAYDSDVASGIKYAVDNGARVINLSLGESSPSFLLEDAVDYAYEKGAVVVAAAGNEGMNERFYPAAYPNVISVAATDESDKRADFSNYDSTVDLAAPGTDIYSTWPGGSYESLSGTSMACPMVSAVAALVLSKNPSLTNCQVKSILFNSADDLGEPGIDPYYGYGRVDAYKALITSPSGLDKYENNNTFDTATPIDLNKPIIATLNPKKDVDFYKFTISQGQNVVIQVTPPPDQDAVMEIYKDDNGFPQYIGMRDNGFKGATEKFDGFLDSGTYYVEVYEANGIPSNNSYTFFVTGDKAPAIAISNISVTPNPFIVDGNSAAVIKFDLSQDSTVSMEILDNSSKTIRQLVSSRFFQAGTNSVTWDGKDDNGLYVDTGKYTVLIEAQNSYGQSSSQSEVFSLTNEIPPQVDNVSANTYFSPKVTSKWVLSYRLSKSSIISVGIYDYTGNLIKVVSHTTQMAGTNSVTWDGKNEADAFVQDGTYTYKICYEDAGGSSHLLYQGTVIVDSRAPVISNVFDSPDPFFAGDKGVVQITFSISERAKVTVNIYKSDNTLFTQLVKDAQYNEGKITVSWNGKNLQGQLGPDGFYKYTIIAVDLAGNVSKYENGQIRLEARPPQITDVTDTPDPLTRSAISFISFKLSEKSKVTLKIYDKLGNLKRILLNNSYCEAGINTVKWDLKDSKNTVVSDGIYTYKIEAVDDFNKHSPVVQGTITVDSIKPTIKLKSPSVLSFVYTGKNVINVNFNLSKNAKVTLRILRSNGALVKYVLSAVPKTAGNVSAWWDGKDAGGLTVPNGTYRFELFAVDYAGNKSSATIGTITFKDTTKPVVTVEQVSRFSPKVTGMVRIGYNLSKSSYVTIGIYTTSGSLIKTIQTNKLVNAGVQYFTWDGKASNGITVSNGTYVYNITAKDANGNVSNATGKIIVDNLGPSLSNTSVNMAFADSSYTSYRLTMHFTVSEDSWVTFVICDSVDVIAVIDCYVEAGSYVGDYFCQDGFPLQYIAFARDLSGNLSNIVMGQIGYQ